MPRKIESIFIDGPAGRLEALLEEPEDAVPTEAALVCHPHPQHGGTMHNKVVYRIARGLRSTGSVVLRFNYRGVNLSEGVYDEGEGELDDARAARLSPQPLPAITLYRRRILLRLENRPPPRLRSRPPGHCCRLPRLLPRQSLARYLHHPPHLHREHPRPVLFGGTNKIDRRGVAGTETVIFNRSAGSLFRRRIRRTGSNHKSSLRRGLRSS